MGTRSTLGNVSKNNVVVNFLIANGLYTIKYYNFNSQAFNKLFKLSSIKFYEIEVKIISVKLYFFRFL
jgi:hypothetical protein